ncbi:MAG: nitrilase-related carbon-nitrogen hydrolase, partial [Actinomycetota bacterium]|nr:nitrilase-related carbon-nitrogen hydrolase [Actinomycetota bacterium]
MRVGLFQFEPSFGERDRNVGHVLKSLAGVQAELVVLPELFDTGYQFTSREEAHELAEDIPGGKTSTRLAEFCRERRMFIVAGIAERVGAKTFNSAALFGPDGHIGTYRKTHLFYEESLWFEPGDTGFKVFDIGSAKLGLMVCF